jgi:GTP cyclohydrolase I
MQDVQKRPDQRQIDIQRVGIKDLHLPLYILQKDGKQQSVLGNLSLSADLPRHYKGSHLSRFVEILLKWSQKTISSVELKKILKETCSALEAQKAQIKINFKYFLSKTSPSSGGISLMDYDCEFTGRLDKKFTFILGLNVPILTLCPCSKEISRYGAHNQRGIIKLKIQYTGRIIWIEDLVAELEKQGSTPIYPLLKRDDEKYITEKAYENPKFVEDVIRDVIIALRKFKTITWYEIECEDFESIHNHSAFAYQNSDLK